MPLEIMFGINASGKDSILGEIKNKNKGVQSTSESRLLMYHLGYIPDYKSEAIVSRDAYKKLENTPQNEIITVTNTVYKETLEDFRNSEIEYFLLSHLVFALTIDKKPVYLSNKDVPEWYKDIGNKFIQIVCSSDEILRRRLKDKNDGIRDRGNMDDLEEINKHQVLCDEKWEKFTRGLSQDRYLTVVNSDFKTAVNTVDNFIKK